MLILLITFVIPVLILGAVIALIWLACHFIAKSRDKRVRYRRFGYVTICISVIWLVLLLYGYFFGRWKYEVKSWDFIDDRIPTCFDGYRIVQISDIHIEGFNDNPAFLDTLIDVVNSQHPDLICFTGDLVSFNSKGVLPFISSLNKLSAPDGVVSILGNHDYGVYDRSLDSCAKEKDVCKLVDSEKNKLKWKLLLNEHYILHRGTDSIAIIGSENQACGLHQRVRRGNIVKASTGTSEIFRILLTHDPSHWDDSIVGETDIPLTLSGHTHAMQTTLFGWTPCRWFFHRSDGPYREGRQQLYVNIGLGELMPFRIGAKPEITVITLRRK